jgi:hypothetical protein
MHRSATRRRRLVLPLLLAVALAVEASGAALAVRPGAPGAGNGALRPGPAGGISAAPGAPVGLALRNGWGNGVSAAAEPVADWAGQRSPAATTAGAARAAAAAATPDAAASVETIGARAAAPAAYRGRNHVWIPSLGISRAVEFFPCSRTKAPGHQMYRWGCAGANNIYLMAHAATVFKPLHNAYVSGRLRVGMQVVYADANGRISTYAVRYWKVVRPDGDVGWAYAAQSTPSMTLQTCVGSDSAHRLVVRLTKVG